MYIYIYIHTHACVHTLRYVTLRYITLHSIPFHYIPLHYYITLQCSTVHYTLSTTTIYHHIPQVLMCPSHGLDPAAPWPIARAQRRCGALHGVCQGVSHSIKAFEPGCEIVEGLFFLDMAKTIGQKKVSYVGI